jgi:D-arabinose 1-dehydrogenase-like Zn-dependent alcohol dehydrogenase
VPQPVPPASSPSEVSASESSSPPQSRVTSPCKAKLAQARDLGVDETLTSDPDAVAAVRELPRGVRADAVFDFVGTDATMDIAIGMARAGGHVAIVGLAGGRLSVGFGATPLETKIVIPTGARRLSSSRCSGLRASERISPHIERSNVPRPRLRLSARRLSVYRAVALEYGHGFL